MKLAPSTIVANMFLGLSVRNRKGLPWHLGRQTKRTTEEFLGLGLNSHPNGKQGTEVDERSEAAEKMDFTLQFLQWHKLVLASSSFAKSNVYLISPQ